MGLKRNVMDKLGVFLSQSRCSGLFSDILISTSEGSHFRAHKLVLGLPWFLQGAQDSDAIILDGFSSSDVTHFMDILYSGLTKFTGEEHLRSLRELAELFGVQNLGLETFLFEEDFEEEDELYYESDESEEMVFQGSSLTVTLEENLSKRDILVQDRVFVCPRCGEGFSSEATLEGHEKTHEEYEEDFDYEDEEEEYSGKKGAHPCKHCSTSQFSSKRELNKHLFLSHSEARSCQKCGKEFKEPKSLAYHSKYVCPKIKREFFKCQICESKFPSPRDARRHEKSVHGRPRAYKCAYCNVCCKSFSFLSNHMKVAHNPEDLRFKCSSCGKAFLKSAYLEDHINRFHVSEKQFECVVCSKRFSTRQDLQKHAKSHEGPMQRCSYCSQAFKYRSTLTQHVRSAHTGDKPYHCRPCSKSFGFLEVLKKHKKSHDRKGHQTIIVTAPKGQKGSKSYIDYSASTSAIPPSSSFLSTSTSTFSSGLCQDDIPHFDVDGFHPTPSTSSKGEHPIPDQITTIDIMELLSKN